MSGTTEHALRWPVVHRGALLSLHRVVSLSMFPPKSQCCGTSETALASLSHWYSVMPAPCWTPYIGHRRQDTVCILWRDSTNTEEKDIIMWIRPLCSVHMCVCFYGCTLVIRVFPQSKSVCLCVFAAQYHSCSPGQNHCYKYSILMVTLWCCLCETMAPGGPLSLSPSPPSSPFPFSPLSPLLYYIPPFPLIQNLRPDWERRSCKFSPLSSAELFICRALWHMQQMRTLVMEIKVEKVGPNWPWW